MNLETKAYLISVGTVDISELSATGSMSQGPSSTAGPGAGESSVFFRSGDRRVRLSVDSGSELRIRPVEGGVAVFRGDEELARGRMEVPLSHCPEQAYITVCEGCIYDCKFCAVPKLKGGVKSKKMVTSIVDAARATGQLKAISLTSGVEESPEAEVERIASMVRDLRGHGVPIGVSVVPTKDSSRVLLEAGASEVKYNVETVDPDLFEVVCPGLSLEEIKDGLAGAVKVFGKNRVFSNVIVGLGESDRVLMDGLGELVEMGVLPGLRAVYPHPLRRDEVEMVRPGPGRLLRLARHLQRALDENGLRGDAAKTMCYRCTGCDLVPHRDL